jgi:hypothetical protein
MKSHHGDNRFLHVQHSRSPDSRTGLLCSVGEVTGLQSGQMYLNADTSFNFLVYLQESSTLHYRAPIMKVFIFVLPFAALAAAVNHHLPRKIGDYCNANEVQFPLNVSLLEAKDTIGYRNVPTNRQLRRDILPK